MLIKANKFNYNKLINMGYNTRHSWEEMYYSDLYEEDDIFIIIEEYKFFEWDGIGEYNIEFVIDFEEKRI